jgi:hypothetical protein
MNICNIHKKHLKHPYETFARLQHAFSSFFFRTTQRKRGIGGRRAAPSRPLLEVSRGGSAERPPVSFGRDVGCHRRKRAEGKAGTSLRWRRPPAGSGRARAWGRGRRCRRLSASSLAGRGQEEGPGDRRSDRRRAEAPRGMRGMEVSQGVERAERDFFRGSTSVRKSRDGRAYRITVDKTMLVQ